MENREILSRITDFHLATFEFSCTEKNGQLVNDDFIWIEYTGPNNE